MTGESSGTRIQWSFFVVLKPYRVLRSKVVSVIPNICVDLDLAFLSPACSLGFLILYGVLYNRSFAEVVDCNLEFERGSS